MTQALAETRRNASVCGCSSMVEQKLPKLLTSAETGHPASKTRHETSLLIQALSFRAQIKLAPPERQFGRGRPNELEARMADDDVIYPPLPANLPAGQSARYTGRIAKVGDQRVAQIKIEMPRPADDLWPYYTPRPLPEIVTIYFVGPKGGPIKIGRAARLDFRLRDLRLANAFPLEVWASFDGPPSLEREYHKRFAHRRLHGEWFERCAEIEAEIDRLNATPLPTPEAGER